MSTRTELLTTARAEALFTSDLSSDASATKTDITGTIRQAMRVYGGVSGCAAEMAKRFGESPETAARRMQWARSVVERSFPARGSGR
jgi:hypothetical protein